MALKTSLVLTGDASSALAALKQTDGALGAAAEEAARFSQAMGQTDKSIARVAAAQSRAKQETVEAKAAFDAGSITQEDYNRRLLETKTALSLVETEHRATVRALNQARAAFGAVAVSAGDAQAGYANLGRQIENVAAEMQGGSNIGAIIGRQGGQVSDAVAQMGTQSGLARHHVQNLAFQFQDLGLQLTAAAASGEPFKLAMMALMQQGGQISGIMAQAGLSVRGLIGQMVALAAPFAPVIAAGAALAAVVGVVSAEINKNSAVTVTWQDTALGAYDAVKSFVSGQLTNAFEYFGTSSSEVWKTVVDTSKWAFNWVIGAATMVPRTLLATWRLIPAGVADIFITAVNYGIRSINALIERTIAGVNGFVGAANGILGRFGLSISTVAAPQIAELANSYAGSGVTLGKAFTGAIKDTVTRDFLGDAAAYLSPFAQQRARDRMAADAKEAGTAAGKSIGKAVAQGLADELKDSSALLADLTKTVGKDLAKGLEADRNQKTKSMWDEIAAQQNEAVDRIRASAEANAAWNQQIEATVGLLGEVGSFGNVLGDIGKAVVAIRTGDFSGVRGPAGALLQSVSRVQWSGQDDGGRYTRTLGEVFSNALEKVFGANGSFAAALQSAGLGMSASRIVLGDRGTGGSIGSAIGGALGGSKVVEKAISSTLGKSLGGIAGPIGSIVGGLLGGVIGGLFQSKPRGTASVTQSNVSVSANTESVKSGLNTIGGQLQQAVQTIADKLGGAVGNYEVGFGQYKDYYQVSNSGSDRFLGQTFYNRKSSQALYDGKDPAAALSAAIGNAVADGAIEGISSRVAAALKSSSDIDKALREAVKVQDLELALGGIGEELRRQFRAFEQQAKERLRIASKYGFDVVAVEKRNAEDRLKLQEKLAKEQVGSLQQLIDDLTAGSLFEGSAVDQRTALLGKIDKARADANSGVEGAADTLNQLLQQLNTVSKDAFGTTGGFATDRQQILDIARDTIAKANQRVAEAQKVSDPALSETNAQLNESNDQLARLAAQTGLSIELLRQLVANTQGGFDARSLIQRARLQ